MHSYRSRALAIVAAASLLISGAVGASAATVDPSTLQPPPPPGAQCHTTGPGNVVCDTVLNATLENAPDFEGPCGVIYLTGTDLRDGFRFYEDGKMVRRHVVGAFNVTASLSPTGDGPTVRLFAHWNWWSVWEIPGGSDDGALVTETGMSLKASAPGLGSSFQIAGRFDPEGNHTGRFTAFSDASLAALCDALGG